MEVIDYNDCYFTKVKISMNGWTVCYSY